MPQCFSESDIKISIRSLSCQVLRKWTGIINPYCMDQSGTWRVISEEIQPYFHELKLRLWDIEVGVVGGQDGPTLDGCTC